MAEVNDVVAELRNRVARVRKVFPPKRLESPEEHCVRLMCEMVEDAATFIKRQHDESEASLTAAEAEKEKAVEHLDKVLRGCAVPEHKLSDAEFLRASVLIARDFAQAARAVLSPKKEQTDAR